VAIGRDCGPHGQWKQATHDNPPALSQHLDCSGRSLLVYDVCVGEGDMPVDGVAVGDENDEGLGGAVGWPVVVPVPAVVLSTTLRLEKDRS